MHRYILIAPVNRHIPLTSQKPIRIYFWQIIKNFLHYF